jgi:hypothetical protein
MRDVDPVPNPTAMPSSTNSTARFATSRFASSCVTDSPRDSLPKISRQQTDFAEKLDHKSDLFSPCKRAYSRSMIETQQLPDIDWTDCSLVERVPGKVSGVPILKGTRV